MMVALYNSCFYAVNVKGFQALFYQLDPVTDEDATLPALDSLFKDVGRCNRFPE